MSRLLIEGVHAEAGEFRLRNVSLAVDDGEVVAVLGPSGAGKSVLLETVAGLHRVRAGRILVDGRDVTHASPQERSLAMVFQDAALFPHMNVRRNILFGTRWRAAGDAEPRMRRLVDLLGLSGLLERDVRTLSGGEAQRVALARALAVEPAVLLLDEPFSALDPPLRRRLRAAAADAVRALRQATLLVTHEQADALAMADRLVVMRDGLIVQSGDVREVMERPADTDVAELVGVETVLVGRVAEARDGLLQIDTEGGRVTAVGDSKVDERVTMMVRAENVALEADEEAAKTHSSVLNRFEGRIVGMSDAGAVTLVRVDCGFVVTAAVTRYSAERLGLKPGGKVWVAFKAVAVHVVSSGHGAPGGVEDS